MNKRIGIIGYGSMGKMLLDKFGESRAADKGALFVTNRTLSKIEEKPDIYTVTGSNVKIAELCDIIFICTRPADILTVLKEISPSVREDTLVVSLNGSLTFETLEKTGRHRFAKVIPSVTAEINKSQTLVTYNDLADDGDKEDLKQLLSCIGNVIELPESEMGMGSELVSCMPGFIASMFDVICTSAQKHTSVPREQIISMVLNTMCSTGELMLRKDMSFEDVVERVATKGGITEVGAKVIYEGFPAVADEMFVKTLEKRAETARK